MNRQGGTTPVSREALRNYLFGSFRNAVMTTTETRICILGDLFDEFEVESRDWIECYMILSTWLSLPLGPEQRRLVLVAGNHDHSPKALRVSSFEMLCQVLKEQFGPEIVTVIGIDGMAAIDGDVTYALAHCSNQDIFNAKLVELLGLVRTGDRVLLHANYDNNFAAVSDHSLNVSAEQARAFATKGATLYFAHEHQARIALDGSVVVFGNQWPSSVSDCLNNDFKCAHILAAGVTAIRVETWSRSGNAEQIGYCEIDWRELGSTPENVQIGGGFIKIVGKASANEAGECISAIAKFRAKSGAFVITNGVKIEGVMDNADLPEAFEATKAFDVLEFINSNLDEAQRVAVAKLQAAAL